MGLRTFLKNWGVRPSHGTHNEDTTKLLSWFLWLVLTWKCSSPSKTWGFQMHVRRIRIFFICMWWKIEKRDPGKLACLILKVTGEQGRPAKCETMVRYAVELTKNKTWKTFRPRIKHPWWKDNQIKNNACNQMDEINIFTQMSFRFFLSLKSNVKSVNNET